MPTTTFFNLPEEKRERFVEVALDEFALNDYRNASVTNMVKELGIAKGSVYQYFTNKKELYHYLIQLATEQKLQVTKPLIQKTGADLWKWYRKLFAKSLMFDLQHPVLGSFMLNVTHERNSPEVGSLVLTHKRESMDFYIAMLKQFQKKGNLSKKIDLVPTAYILSQTAFGFLDGLCIEQNIDLREHARNHEPVTSVGEEAVKSYLKKITTVLSGTVS
ncbi:MAG: TetR/AcrR family transcriptional regulator [Leptolyngbya sp. SIO3F4]|nr:TetR/AcrR family transcriptional regulator [Leptolyngbya sp. SIO3F4]